MLLQETMAALFEAAPDALVIFDARGEILVASGETQRLFGYQHSELVGEAVQSLIPALFHSEVSECGTRAARSDLGARGIRKDGTAFPAEVSTASVVSSQGAVTLASIRDVTARQQAEAAKSQLAAIVDSSQDAIIGLHLDGTIVSWNGGAQRTFGYDREEVIGANMSILVPPELMDGEAQLVERLRRGERLESFETRRRCKDGRDVDVSLAISPIYGSRGDVIGASEVARDISERKRGELEMMKALDAIEASNRELEAFSYSVAHDLRAPLRGIDGFSRELSENYHDKLDEDGKKCLSRIRSSAQRMGELIHDLLSLARITRSDLFLERVNLSELVSTVLETLAESHPDRMIDQKVQEDLWTFGDKRMLTIALENLLGNSWKFTRNRPDAQIEFGCVSEEGSTAYYVRDNGAGFDMSYASKLFSAFQRLHTEREFEGTGIGLATVQRIIRRHGGEIWAQGEVSHGATFYFSLG